MDETACKTFLASVTVIFANGTHTHLLDNVKQIVEPLYSLWLLFNYLCQAFQIKKLVQVNNLVQVSNPVFHCHLNYKSKQGRSH